MTETFGGVTVTPGDSAEYDSVGLPIPMTEIKVRYSNGSVDMFSLKY